jgi:hypothetical protein
MDHLFEHENDPVPDLASITPSSSSGNRGNSEDAEDEGDLDALAGVADAKVTSTNVVTSTLREIKTFKRPEHQMLRMWKSIQEHSASQLPRRKKWS